MKTYEYSTVRDNFSNPAVERHLNALARAGWEPHLVLSPEGKDQKSTILFRREVKPVTPEQFVDPVQVSTETIHRHFGPEIG